MKVLAIDEMGGDAQKLKVGDEFGMFTDKFGMHWMVNISPQ